MPKKMIIVTVKSLPFVRLGLDTASAWPGQGWCQSHDLAAVNLFIEANILKI